MTSPALLSATAFVVTSRPERYIKQLVGHFGVCQLRAAPTGIELIGTAEDAARLETLKDVVARHLVRFGVNDQFTVSWTP